MKDRKPLLTPKNPVKSRAGQKGGHVWRSNFKLKGSATDGVRKAPTP